MSMHLSMRSSVRRAAMLTALLLAASALVAFAAPAQRAAAADPECTVNALMVNSCRPWFGGSSNGYAETASDTQSQSLYFEQRTGRQMDMVHNYHGAGNQSHVLSPIDLYFINRPDTLLYLNWPVTNTFKEAAPVAEGGSATVNGYIDQMARSFKALPAGKKVFLAIHHEPENDIAFTCPGQSTKPGTMGTAQEYVDMWHNIRARFDALGVDNVIWVMNYMNYPAYECMIDDVWPGNDYVDYISFNGYHSTDRNVSFEYEVGLFYDFLTENSTPEHDYLSKEWGIVEWGIHSSTQANAYLYYQQAKTAVENKVFPKLRFYMIFDNGDRNRDIWDFQVAYTRDRTYDPQEQIEFNAFANSWALTGNGQNPDEPDPTDEAPSTPGGVAAILDSGQPRVSWSASTDDVAVTGYDVYRNGAIVGSTTDALTYTDTSAPQGATHSYTVVAKDASGNRSVPSAAVSIAVPDSTAPGAPGNVAVALSSNRPRVSWTAATDNVGVTSYQVLRNGTVLGSTSSLAYTDTTAVRGSTYTYTVRARDAANNTGTSSAGVTYTFTVPDTTAPSAPASLRVARNGTRATLTWGAATDNVGVTNYLVYRGTTLIGTVGSTVRTLTATGLTTGTTYTFSVRARDAALNLGAARTARG